MRFQVPQFIDFEDKVFGPFTFKQFIYIAGGIGISFVLLRMLPRFFAIMAIIPVILFSAALAFYRINNKPFVQMVESFFRYMLGSRLYIWQQPKEKAVQSTLVEKYMRLQVPRLRNSKLKELAWNIDIRGRNTIENK